MPRPRDLPRWTAVAILCAAVPPPALHAALAAAAGTLFEAAPFVLAGSVVRLPWLRRLAVVAGCGCARAPGAAALSLPATALCWVTFGPFVAAGRFVAGAFVALLHARGASALRLARASQPDLQSSVAAQPMRATSPADAFAEFQTIALQGFIFGVAIALWQSGAPSLAGTVAHTVAAATYQRLPASFARAQPALGAAAAVLVPWLWFAAGMAAGRLAPCATAGVAVAAMLRAASPWAAYGMLATAGLWASRRDARSAPVRRDARAGYALLAMACAAMSLEHGRGFVNPRLVPFVAIAAVVCALRLRRRPVTYARAAAAAPAFMLAALAFGSPLPASTPTATEAALVDVFPGQPIAFVGTLAADRVRLVRYVISCCRADATAVAIRLARPSTQSPGAWLAAEGIAVRTNGELVLDVRSSRRIAAPLDPFAYR